MHELNTIITNALKQLAETQRECFVRHHIFDESIENIAEVMDKSPHAIKQILYRTRQQLRSILERKGYDESSLREYLIPNN